jgi:hypothetical protein
VGLVLISESSVATSPGPSRNSCPTALIDPSSLYSVDPVPTYPAPFGSFAQKRLGELARKGKYIETKGAESRKAKAWRKKFNLQVKG